MLRIQTIKTIIITIIFLFSIGSCQKSAIENTKKYNSVSVIELNQIASEYKQSIYDIGTFPYIYLPKNTQYTSSPLVSENDVLFAPYHHALIKVKGRTFKTFVDRTEDKEWSENIFLKSIEQQIFSKGGVLLYKGNMAADLVQFLKKQNYMVGEEGSINFETEKIYVYGLLRKDYQHILIVVSANKNSGAIQIIQNQK